MNIKIAGEEEKNGALALRFEVFVREQNVPEELETDDEDDSAVHIVAQDDKGSVIGCARVLMSHNDAHIGRLAVKKELRGLGVGSAICRFIIDYCRENGCTNIWLNSQLNARGFYENLGFESSGDVFTEAGIEHIRMTAC